MSILPVIVRELRSQARQPLTYWLRVLGGVSIAAAFALALGRINSLKHSFGGAGVHNPVQTFGTALFGKLNLLIFLAIWLFVPLSTADAISRERREGTMALLYLTELRSWGIVLGKACVHILRALSLFLTMAPWLMLPVLFGGVGPRDILLALMLDSVALLLALAAGLLASTIPRDWLKAVILAELFSLLLLIGMLNAHENVLKRAINAGTPVPPAVLTSVVSFPPRMMLMSQFDFSGGIIRRNIQLIEFTTNSSFDMSPRWGYGGRVGGLQIDAESVHWPFMWANLQQAGHQAWFQGVGQMIAQAALVLLGAIWIAAWCVRRSWKDAPPQAFVGELRQKFFSPRFRVAALRRNLSRSLTANPIGWLQHYSPTARLVKWGWCFFILFVEILFSSNATDLYDAQTGLGLVLLAGLTFSATGSFRNELETGAFELLLVTPLRERQIILGRLRGLWNQFLPAIAIYGAGSIYLASGWAAADYARQAWLGLAATVAAFCVLPVVGLYFSVQRLNFFVAWICACAIGVVPAGLAWAFGVSLPVAFLLHLIVGLIMGALLERRLRNRGFLTRSA